MKQNKWTECKGKEKLVLLTDRSMTQNAGVAHFRNPCSKKRKNENNWAKEKHTFPLSPWNSGELIIANAGARKTNDGPCINGNLEPKDVCKRVVTPETKSTVDTTFEVSSYKPLTPIRSRNLHKFHTKKSLKRRSKKEKFQTINFNLLT